MTVTASPTRLGPQPDSPYLSVIVVNYNAQQWLGRCIAALRMQTWRDFEIIVIDNGSTDGSIEALDAHKPHFLLLKSSENLGFAAACNLAARRASGQWLVTLNPDAFPDAHWLEELVEASRRHPDAVMFGSTQLDANMPDRLDGVGDPYHALGFAWRGGKGGSVEHLPEEGEVFGPCAAAAMYRSDAFRDAGGFDASFFCYYEDVDLAFRIRLRGGYCIQVPGATVHHVGSGIAGTESAFSTYHIFRNRIWTFLKNMPGPLFLVLALPFLLVLIASVARSLRRGLASSKLRALADAARQTTEIIHKRRLIQARRTRSTSAIARAFTWSLQAAIYRRTDVRRAHPSTSQPHTLLRPRAQ